MEGVKESGAAGVVDAGAGDQPPPDDLELAPYGWMRDAKTKTWRARKKAGRAGLPAAKPEDDGGQAPDQGQAAAPAGRDPEPARLSSAQPGKNAPPKITQETRDDIAGIVALLYSLPADFLVMMDPYCFGALNQSLEQVIDATVPIICRSQLVVDFVTGKQGLILYIKLAAALRPFLTAVWAHHVIHIVTLEKDEEGHAVVQREDWSAYTAA